MQTFEKFKQEMQTKDQNQLKLFYSQLVAITIDPNHANNLRDNNQKKDHLQRLLAEKGIDVTYN